MASCFHQQVNFTDSMLEQEKRGPAPALHCGLHSLLFVFAEAHSASRCLLILALLVLAGPVEISPNNALQGQISPCLANLTSLRYLNLSSNMLNSTIPSTFWSLEYILVVDFSFNLLSGCLPQDIGNLKVLTGLYLSGNQISCSIPSGISGLKDLTYLGLATNGFQGFIPESMGSLISLESLDLSDNKFSGVIPKSFEALSHLSFLNVSFNGLEGEIPSGGPFVNFTAESFMQNLALCVSSRLQVPPCKTGSSQQSKATGLVLRYILPAIATTMVVLALIIILLRRRKRNKSRPTENNLLNTAALRRISYQELRLATNGFSESNLLGVKEAHYSAVKPHQQTISSSTVKPHQQTFAVK